MHRIFERRSTIGEYWLANCEGFTVARSASRLRVRAVVVDPANGRAHGLLVSRGSNQRSRVLPAERIHAVDPFDRVLYVEPRHTLQKTTRRGGVELRRGLVWLWPRLRAAAIAAYAYTLALAAWLRPRVAHAVREASRVVIARLRQMELDERAADFYRRLRVELRGGRGQEPRHDRAHDTERA